MYTHHLILILHLIAATIWVGGHLVLAIGYLPKALKHKDFSYIGNFEKTYEPIGMPSLATTLASVLGFHSLLLLSAWYR